MISIAYFEKQVKNCYVAIWLKYWIFEELIPLGKRLIILVEVIPLCYSIKIQSNTILFISVICIY